jgi:hypothetical protein
VEGGALYFLGGRDSIKSNFLILEALVNFFGPTKIPTTFVIKQYHHPNVFHTETIFFSLHGEKG